MSARGLGSTTLMGLLAVCACVTGQESIPILDTFPDNHQWRTLPWGNDFIGQLVHTRAVQPYYWTVEGVGDQYDPLHPLMYIEARDCHGDMVAGLRLETDADCAPFERCDFYWDGAALLSDGEQTRALANASVTTPLPANQTVTIRLIDTETGGLVSQFSTNLPPATQHTWWAYPLTDTQQAELP